MVVLQFYRVFCWLRLLRCSGWGSVRRYLSCFLLSAVYSKGNNAHKYLKKENLAWNCVKNQVPKLSTFLLLWYTFFFYRGLKNNSNFKESRPIFSLLNHRTLKHNAAFVRRWPTRSRLMTNLGFWPLDWEIWPLWNIVSSGAAQNSSLCGRRV